MRRRNGTPNADGEGAITQKYAWDIDSNCKTHTNRGDAMGNIACPKCGATTHEDSAFCLSCAHELRVSSMPAQNNSSQARFPHFEEDNKQKGVPFFWVIGLLVFVVICYPIGQGNNGIAAAAAVGFFGGGIVLYFAPAIVAGSRGHANSMSISILNLFLGWTLIGWVAALVWAYSESADKATAASSQTKAKNTEAAPSAGSASDGAATKKCPYCAEDVRVEAIKCKHCHSDLVVTGP